MLWIVRFGELEDTSRRIGFARKIIISYVIVLVLVQVLSNR